MKAKALSLLMLGLVAIPLAASANVLNFDDLSGGGTVGTYHGFTFSDWYYYSDPQAPYTAESSPERLYDLSNSNSIASATPFTFDGAWFAGYDFAGITFDLYKNGVLVATSGTLDPSSTPAFLSSGYSGLVDEVVVESPNPDYFVMDNFTYDQTTQAPEPGTLALLGAGLAALGWAVSRRRKVS